MSDGPDPATIARRIAQVRARLAAAGADPDRVRLVAVTKGFAPEVARAALAAGVVDLGENYAQELVAKAALLGPGIERDPPGPTPAWHMIGRLQRNKVRLLAPVVAVWQSVDRPELAAEIARRAPGATVFVQVNATGEPDKGGCPPSGVPALVDTMRTAGLDVCGVMAVGPTGDRLDPRPAFAVARELADSLGLTERSFGMSGDLEAAVAEGTTMVRIGTALFGPRPPRPVPSR